MVRRRVFGLWNAPNDVQHTHVHGAIASLGRRAQWNMWPFCPSRVGIGAAPWIVWPLLQTPFPLAKQLRGDLLALWQVPQWCANTHAFSALFAAILLFLDSRRNLSYLLRRLSGWCQHLERSRRTTASSAHARLAGNRVPLGTNQRFQARRWITMRNAVGRVVLRHKGGLC